MVTHKVRTGLGMQELPVEGSDKCARPSKGQGRSRNGMGSKIGGAPFFFTKDTMSGQHICAPCVDIQKEDSSHNIAKYSSSTTTGTLRGHLCKIHLRVYITALEQHNLKVEAKEVRDLLDIGWTLAQIGQELDQNPDKLLELFSSPPWWTGVSALADEILDYTIEEMHRQVVKFIVVDDQNALSSVAYFYFCGKIYGSATFLIRRSYMS
ncbi:uncharacterized protein EDB93DRAFT_1107436 [Suillus bovinus]|uniref:uncharacterized protein n=1 Tax=Suillus bovinus TaxID=48563 RepID=UPI001B8642F0|nr:uncharacterized protein EDB93DRAFT_1107436 [Suillus bovinus]KAG2134063.1 hypothetical protein EDB93DRAFT_1107436 [Suillus bovinus]